MSLALQSLIVILLTTCFTSLSYAKSLAQKSYPATLLFNKTLTSLGNASSSLKNVNNISSKNKPFYSLATINTAALQTLNVNDLITFNVLGGATSGRIVKIFTGASGAKHITVQTTVNNTNVSSVITIGESDVFMDIVTEKGSFTASGNKQQVLIHKPSELYGNGQYFLDDAITTTPQTPSNPILQTNGYIKSATQRVSSYPTTQLSTINTQLNNKDDYVQSLSTSAGSENIDIATIDIFFVYSSNVYDVIYNIDTRIDHLIAYANQAFEDSDIFVKLRFKGILEVDYPYTNGREALYDIRDGNSPFEDVEKYWLESGADAVALLTPQKEGDSSAGVAFLNTHIKYSSADMMYSQTDIDSGASTFAHEIGHNLGLGHSRPQSSLGADFAHGVGFRIPAPSTVGFNTIMSYGTSGAFTEVPLFSNPNKQCGDFPCGVSKSDLEFGADATHAVNSVRHIVADYGKGGSDVILLSDALNNVVDDNLRTCLASEADENTRFTHQIKNFFCSRHITTLDGIEQFSDIDDLYLSNAFVDDISNVGELSKLSRLVLYKVNASNFDVLTELANLDTLELRGDSITNENIAFLSSLNKLRRLTLRSKNLSELPNLSSSPLLELINIHAPLLSLDSISQNRNLDYISIRADRVNLPQSFDWPLLTQLNVDGGNIPSLGKVSSLSLLNNLSLVNVGLTELTSISTLKNLQKLNVSDNEISDISEIIDIPLLASLDISRNPITTMSTVQSLSNLTTLRAGQYGETYDWSFVNQLSKLRNLSLTSVNAEDIYAISELSSSLETLSLFEVSATDLSSLFQFYGLSTLSVNASYDTPFFCWQKQYLETFPSNYGNVFSINCDDSNDINDFDGDGVSNINELAMRSNPTENDNQPATIEFLNTAVSINEQEGGIDFYGTIRRKGNSKNYSGVSITNYDISTNLDDYYLYSRGENFGVGENKASFRVSIYDDDFIEGTETFELSLSNPSGAELGENDILTVEINDDIDGSDDVEPGVYLNPHFIGWENTFISVSESEQQVVLMLHRPADFEGEFSVDVSVVPLTKGSENAFTVDKTHLYFAADDTFKSLTVNFIDDNIFEANRYIAFRLFNAVNVRTSLSHNALTLEIEDDEAEGRKIQFEQMSYNVQEGAGAFDIVIKRESNDIVPRTVSLYQDSGNATLGEDIVLSTTSFTMLPNEKEKTIKVTVVDDQFYEVYESLQLRITDLPFELRGVNRSVNIGIRDNDTQGSESGKVSFTARESTAYEPVHNGYRQGKNHIIDITRNGDLSDTLTVGYRMETGSADDTDFGNYPNRISFAPGENRKQISIQIFSDSEIESDEDFFVHLDADDEHIGDIRTHRVKITENSESGYVFFAQPNQVAFEGDTVDLAIMRSGDLSGSREAYITISERTANKQDYRTDGSTSIFFAPGETEKTVPIQIVDDGLDERIESFYVSLSADDYNAIDTPSGVEISIIDNDSPRSTPYDYDGDGKSDIVIRRPGIGQFIVARSSDNTIMRAYFGSMASDIPLAGDFDGDGITDIAIRRTAVKQFISRTTSDDKINRIFFGSRDEDIPVIADYDGDGIDDIAIRRPSSGQWFIKYSTTGEIVRETFGTSASDVPAVADYDGDGKADIAVRRQDAGQFIIKYSTTGEIDRIFFGSQATDIAVPADYDGDGKADIAIRRPSSGFWFIKRSTDNVIERTFFGSQADDIPVVADYDGDGIADIAIRRPTSGTWVVKQSSDGSYSRFFFGSKTTDIPLAAPLDTVQRLTSSTSYSLGSYIDSSQELLSGFEADSSIQLIKEKIAPQDEWQTQKMNISN